MLDFCSEAYLLLGRSSSKIFCRKNEGEFLPLHLYLWAFSLLRLNLNFYEHFLQMPSEFSEASCFHALFIGWRDKSRWRTFLKWKDFWMEKKCFYQQGKCYLQKFHKNDFVERLLSSISPIFLFRILIWFITKVIKRKVHHKSLDCFPS